MPEEYRQIIGNHEDIYKWYYILNFINYDTLVIYLGITQRNDLIQAISYFKYYKEAPD